MNMVLERPRSVYLGTQTIHKELEDTISQFFNSDDTILYSSCFDANGGLFETFLGKMMRSFQIFKSCFNN
ncbi:MAG: hypothetical protein Ct9H90mP20_3420 [Candidatus Neomarinimicrobiota bacterium]|nr:MAG: hypothetical protein Ct9H90mP20_3420 [Candidatus Neomarinimicrobiota bacterium]